ncbi:M56 family metallopeptidase [Sabulibacter ruber]|uniref:M56 family metallopeptidase n=1 Tax=Sabulibacter ruber TaxID=2811901 RepID=UPI001A97AC05|nr:M56 family metallopeptidase [Sabulibacter ruber]
MQNSLVSYLLESSVCLLAFYLLYFLLLRNETCFRYNRFYLLSATVVSFLLPFLELASFQKVVALPVTVPSLTPYVVNAAIEARPVIDNSPLSWVSVLLLLYGTGVVLFSVRFTRQLLHLTKFIRKHKEQAEIKHGITVIPTHGEWPTFSFFRYLFWDNSHPLTQEEQERILQHERVHIKQRHSFDLIYLEIMAIVFWFNPLLRLYRKALMATHEFLADAHVIQTEDKTAYGLLLAKQVLQKNNFALGHYFNKSLTLKRLKMIHQTQSSPSKVKQALAFPLLGLLALSLSSNQLPLKELNKASSSVERGQTKAHTQTTMAPQYPGGEKELLKFIGQTFRIPQEASKNNYYGGVFIQATIAKDGTPGDFKVLKGSHALLENEALRVIQKMPKWEPSGTSATYIFPFSVVIDGFKNDRQVINQKFEQALAQVSSQATAKSIKVTAPVVLVGYGPAE